MQSRFGKRRATAGRGSSFDRGKTVTEPFTLIRLGKLRAKSRFPKLLKILKVELTRKTGTLRVNQAL